MLNIGDPAPQISLEGSDGKSVSLKTFLGKKVVLYFYPKDNTPGCTLEAQGFRNHIKAFEAANAVVIGVSKDSISSHCNFIEKHGLPFLLLSDPNHTLADAFGAFGEKKLYGKLFKGLIRSTFVLDESGHLAKSWRNVRVSGHVEKVLEFVQNM